MDIKTKIRTAGNNREMNRESIHLNETAAEKAFSKQAPLFDTLYCPDSIIQYKRKRVRDHVEKFLLPDSSILELNAGTGEDTVYFAEKKYRIHATDISKGMQTKLAEKIKMKRLEKYVSQEICSYTELENLSNLGPYDLVFSNFAGLNCTNKLEKVLESLTWLVKPGGVATLVILPKFCFWEFMLLFKGKLKTAFRRFSGKKGTVAHIEGEYFRCWYYNPSFIKKHTRHSFDMIGLEGLCSIVPPSYFENFAQKHPRLFKKLTEKEDKYKTKWPWRLIGDYYVITLRKKSSQYLTA